MVFDAYTRKGAVRCAAVHQSLGVSSGTAPSPRSGRASARARARNAAVFAALLAGALLAPTPVLAQGAPAPTSSGEPAATAAPDWAQPAAPAIGDPFASGPASPDPAAAVESGASLEAKGLQADTFLIGLPVTFKQSEARQILALVNQARAAAGSAALTWDENLEQVALLRAAEITVSFSHTRLNGKSCFTAANNLGVSYGYAVGENIYMGYGTNPSAAAANAAWTKSPGHYSNMVNGSFTSMAAAVAVVNGCQYWVEFFGATSGTGFTVTAFDGSYTMTSEATADYLPYVFRDVKSSDWFVTQNKGRDFLYAMNNGFMKGYSGSYAFGPYDGVSRGQVATILYRMAGEPKVSGSAGFADVSSGAYYANAVSWARSIGVITGYAGTNNFGPDNLVSRADLVTILYRYAKYAGLSVSASTSKVSQMSDWDQVPEYAREPFAWAVDRGIMTGVGGTALQPGGTAWRCSMATMSAKFHRDVLN